MTDALTIIGAFFSVGIGTMLGLLIVAHIFRSKDYGIDEGHVVMAVVIGIMAGLATAGFVAGSLWF